MGVRNGGEPKRAAGLFSWTMQHNIFYGIGFEFVWHSVMRVNVLQWHSAPQPHPCPPLPVLGGSPVPSPGLGENMAAEERTFLVMQRGWQQIGAGAEGLYPTQGCSRDSQNALSPLVGRSAHPCSAFEVEKKSCLSFEACFVTLLSSGWLD
jgi:hypothetical protein